MMRLYPLTLACIVSMVVIYGQADAAGSCMQDLMETAGIPSAQAADYESQFSTIGICEEEIYTFNAEKLSLLMRRDQKHAKQLKDCLVGKQTGCRGYHPCQIGGECLFNDTQKRYVCQCANGRRGASCQQDVYLAATRAASSAISKLDKRLQEQASNASNALKRIEKLEETLALCSPCARGQVSGQSCKDIKVAYEQRNGVSPPSGLYSVTVSGVSKEVYCEMERHGGGWTRVADIQPTEQQSCPGNLLYRDLEVKVCTPRPEHHGSCGSASFPSVIGEYSEVMGFVTGYRDRSTDAFFQFAGNTNAPFADGVSIFQGSPGEHIWTFTAGYGDSVTRYHCPCSASPGAQPPSSVGNNYYCTDYGSIWDRWQFQNPAAHLWSTTQECSPGGSCCSNPDMPWFKRSLSSPTNGDLELRMCIDQAQGDEDMGIDAASIYVR